MIAESLCGAVTSSPSDLSAGGAGTASSETLRVRGDPKIVETLRGVAKILDLEVLANEEEKPASGGPGSEQGGVASSDLSARGCLQKLLEEEGGSGSAEVHREVLKTVERILADEDGAELAWKRIRRYQEQNHRVLMPAETSPFSALTAEQGRIATALFNVSALKPLTALMDCSAVDWEKVVVAEREYRDLQAPSWKRATVGSLWVRRNMTSTTGQHSLPFRYAPAGGCVHPWGSHNKSESGHRWIPFEEAILASPLEVAAYFAFQILNDPAFSP